MTGETAAGRCVASQTIACAIFASDKLVRNQGYIVCDSVSDIRIVASGTCSADGAGCAMSRSNCPAYSIFCITVWNLLQCFLYQQNQNKDGKNQFRKALYSYEWKRIVINVLGRWGKSPVHAPYLLIYIYEWSPSSEWKIYIFDSE